MEFILDNLEVISGLLLGGIAIVGVYLGKAKRVLKEVVELLQAVVDALEDNKISKEEVLKIIKEAKDIPGAFLKVK